MEGYKIKVSNESESREVQELFFELGYCWNTGLGVKNLDAKFLYAKNNTITMGYCSDNFSDSGSKQLTLSKLRDIVAQSKNEQGLISGADAKLAWAKGENVQARPKTLSETWEDLSGKHSLDIFEQVISYEFRLKPCTITLNIEIPAPFEPKEGETYYFITTSNSQGFDFTEFEDSDGDKLYMQLGAYRSASDASKAFEAMRGGIKG